MNLISSDIEIKIEIWGEQHNAIAVLTGNKEDWSLESLWLLDDEGNKDSIWFFTHNEKLRESLDIEINDALERLE